MAVALLAGAGWWLVRAPAIAHVAATPLPEIDLDPPGVRAQREAALAIATMPEDPWTFAESLAASAPDKVADREQCGVEEGPQFSNPPEDGEIPVQTRASTARYLGAQARLDAGLRTSADPFDRAVADFVNIGDLRSTAGRDEAVVQQAAASEDPRLYALGYGLCHSMRAAPPSCARVSAVRWAQVDVGNGIPWLHLLSQAQAAGDATAVRDAMAHLAAADRFDLYINAAAGAVAEHVVKEDPDLGADGDLVSKAFGEQLGLSFPSFQPLIQICRDHAGGDEGLEKQCRATSDSMFAHSDNLMSESISGALLFQLTGDASRRDLVRAEHAVFQAHWSPATGFSPCQEIRESIRFHVRSAQIGEVEALRERARKFVTP